MKTKKELYTDFAIFFAIGCLAFIGGYVYAQQSAIVRSAEVMNGSNQYDAYDLTYIAIGETPE